MTLADRNAWAEAKAESLATLQRIAHVRVDHRDHYDDPLTRWRAEMPQKPPPVTADEVRKIVDDKIAAAAETHARAREATMEVIALALADTYRKMRAEFQEQLGLLRADVEIEKAHASDHAKIIDMPALPLRGGRRA